MCKQKQAKTKNPQLHVPNFVSVQLVTFTKMHPYCIKLTFQDTECTTVSSKGSLKKTLS